MTDDVNSSPTILLTGGTGFVGRYITQELLRRNCRVRLLVRNLASVSEDESGVEAILGDVLEPETLTKAMHGCTAVIHLVGIIREVRSRGVTFDRVHVEGTRNVTEAAKNAGIQTFVHMSANGASEAGSTRYLTSKWEAEEIVRSAGFERWTIFCPSIIFGKPGPGCPEFATQLVNTLLRPFPIWPIFGDGMYRLQPVGVENVAEAFVRATTEQRFSGRTYSVGGAERFTYLEILDILAKAAGLKSRPKIHQPLWFIRPIVQLFSPTGLLPITTEQLDMLVGGNTCDASPFLSDFEIEPIPFNLEQLSYVRSR